MTFVKLLIALGAAAGMLLASRRLVHFFQLESYQFPGYRRSLQRAGSAVCLPGLCMGIAAGLTVLLTRALSGVTAVIASIILAVALGFAGWLVGKKADGQKAKKPLVYTARVKRLLVVLLIVLVLLLLWAQTAKTISAVLLTCGIGLLLPLVVALAGLLAWPIEKGISELYFRDARRKLMAQKDLIRIGITGSYGKTSVKFILATLLSEKYQVLATPASFNTPMGLTRVIRERLQPSHRIFLAEMGARHVGDIKELCRLVHPQIGVLTSVGPQHLDTFRTVDRIASTKYELMDAIPEDGCCFFPNDGAICTQLWVKTKKEKYLSGVERTDDTNIWCEDLHVSPAGSTFLLCTKDDKIECTTRLLGPLNIQNILNAANVCLKLDMTLKQIARGIARLEPVEHRLQLLPSAGGITVIDDAFNSNPTGAKNAVKVLGGFDARRIIITPGMVELGAEEADYNRELGNVMAENVDVAILVGRKHTAPIAEGLKASGFPESSIHVTACLDEATALLKQIGRPGDVVLFENDLPDNYSEA